MRSNLISFDMIYQDSFIRKIIEKSGIKLNEQTKTPTYDTRAFVIKSMVGYFIKDACTASRPLIDKYIQTYSSLQECINEKCIILSSEVEENRQRVYEELIDNRVICSEQISISDAKSEYLIKQLFRAFYTHPKQLPDYVLEKYCKLADETFDSVLGRLK